MAVRVAGARHQNGKGMMKDRVMAICETVADLQSLTRVGWNIFECSGLMQGVNTRGNFCKNLIAL